MPLRFWYVVVGGLPLVIVVGLMLRERLQEPESTGPEPAWHGIVKPVSGDASTWRYRGPFTTETECDEAVRREHFNMNPAASFLSDCGQDCSKEPNGHLRCARTVLVSGN